MGADEEDATLRLRARDHVLRGRTPLLGRDLEAHRRVGRSEQRAGDGRLDGGDRNRRGVRIAERRVDRPRLGIEDEQCGRAGGCRVLRLLVDEADAAARDRDLPAHAREVAGLTAVVGRGDVSAQSAGGRRRRVVDRLDPDRALHGRELARDLPPLSVRRERETAHLRPVTGRGERIADITDGGGVAGATRDACSPVCVGDFLQRGEVLPHPGRRHRARELGDVAVAIGRRHGLRHSRGGAAAGDRHGHDADGGAKRDHVR